jgi:uncharacterized protein
LRPLAGVPWLNAVMKIKLAVLALCTAAVAVAADALPLTFNAILTVGKEKRFGVVTDGGTKSAWLEVGEQFQGYTLKEFDEQKQSLVLEKGGETVRVPLAASAAKTLETKATIAQAADVMSKMKFDQMLEKMIEQQKSAVVNMSKQMMGGMAGKVPAEEFADLQRKMMDAIWSEMKPEEMKNEMTKIYADLFSPDELRGMSEFYSTPTGQALIDKQPEMQQRLMQVMMPRMMQAMPRVQQLAQEFAQKQAAKMNPPAGAPTPPPAAK